MAFKLKGFGQAKITDDTNNMTKGAVIKMNTSPVMSHCTSPVKQTRGTSTKDDLYATDETGATIGIRGTTFDQDGNRQTYVPDPERLRKIRERNKSGDLPKYEDYKGSIVFGDNDRVRGFKDDKGNFTRFTNPTSRESLTKDQKKQLQDFEKTRDTYNKRQAESRRFQKALINYPETGRTARRTSTKKPK